MNAETTNPVKSNSSMKKERKSGILLHPSSFPGRFGIGDLGAEAYHFIDFLERTDQQLWQVLPLGPAGYGDSPYASFSSFAGNSLLISLPMLVEEGDLSHYDIADPPPFPRDNVDYGWVISWKYPLLQKAAETFLKKASASRRKAFSGFCKENRFWLENYSLFMAVKEHYDEKAQAAGIDGVMWNNYWDEGIALRDPEALKTWKERCAEDIEIHKVLQFLFFTQWRRLKNYANTRGIDVIGDIPIFVAPDSADIWSNRDLFLKDEKGTLTAVAGVPPDYFSATGQLWGNPLYHWQNMKKTGFQWWIERIKGMFNLVDIVRIDHFRGFQAFWKIPAGEPTAVNGKWTEAPGEELFTAVRNSLGNVSIIAEDLGIITEDVEQLRHKFGFPGMAVLQFAFGFDHDGLPDAGNGYLPHNLEYDQVIYTGTHDNDTTLGWYSSESERTRDWVRRYFARDDHDIVWDFIRAAESSIAKYAIIPMQDVLSLDSSCRMNTPSTLGDNWRWRYLPEQLLDVHTFRLLEMTRIYGRGRSYTAESEENLLNR